MNEIDLMWNQARKLHESVVEWKSIGEQVRYSFIEVGDDWLTIGRQQGAQVTMRKKGVILALNRLKKEKSLPRDKVISSVIRQTALILLHPSIHFNKRTKEIYWKESAWPVVFQLDDTLSDAKDDELEKIRIWVNKRINQGGFRRNVMKAYGGKCAISGCTLDAVLEAAHIEEHSIAGVNSTANGLLLRSDLHSLFDKGLITVHPDTRKVHIHKSLKGTEYEMFGGRTAFLPVNIVSKSSEILRVRWLNRKLNNL